MAKVTPRILILAHSLGKGGADAGGNGRKLVTRRSRVAASETCQKAEEEEEGWGTGTPCQKSK